MELEKLFQKKYKRLNFFKSLGAGLAGYAVMRAIPFGSLGRSLFKDKKDAAGVKIKINPLAVSRKKIGGNNGRS